MAQVPLWRELEVGPSLPQRALPPSYPLGCHRQVKAPFGARMPCGSREESAGFPEGSPASGKRAERSGGVTPTAAWIWGSAPASQALSSTPSQPRTRRRPFWAGHAEPAPSHLREAFPSSPALLPGAPQAGRLRRQRERGGGGWGAGAASATSTLSRAVLQWGRLRHPGPCRAAAGWNAARRLWLGASGCSLASLLAGTSHSSSLSGTGTRGEAGASGRLPPSRTFAELTSRPLRRQNYL